VSENRLYVANSSVIKIISLDEKPAPGETKEMEKDEENIRTYKFKEPCKIHGFIENKHSFAGKYQITLVETEDNQIDFARLYIKEQDVLKGDISFLSYGEVVPRNVRFDPIKQLNFVFLSSEFLH